MQKEVIEIEGMCFHTFPCEHDVKINGLPRGSWDGVKIYKWHAERGLPVPAHFEEYARFANK